MDGQTITKKYSLEEVRKKYPKAGMKWEKEEDEKLKLIYSSKQPFELASFDSFVYGLTQEFGRAAGGLKARLAMHFDNVPGWDSRQIFLSDCLLFGGRLP